MTREHKNPKKEKVMPLSASLSMILIKGEKVPNLIPTFYMGIYRSKYGPILPLSQGQKSKITIIYVMRSCA